MSKKKNVAKGLGVSSLAAATLLSGLGLGPAAASAAPVPSEEAKPMIMVDRQGHEIATAPAESAEPAAVPRAAVRAIETAAADGIWIQYRSTGSYATVGKSGDLFFAKSFPTAAQAAQYSRDQGTDKFTFPTSSWGDFRYEDGCLRSGGYGRLAGSLLMIITWGDDPNLSLFRPANCGRADTQRKADATGVMAVDSSRFKLENGRLVWAGSYYHMDSASAEYSMQLNYVGVASDDDEGHAPVATWPRKNSEQGPGLVTPPPATPFDASATYDASDDSFMISGKTSATRSTVQYSTDGSTWSNLTTSSGGEFEGYPPAINTRGREIWVREGTSGSGKKLTIRKPAITNPRIVDGKFSGSGVGSGQAVHVSTDRLAAHDIKTFTPSGSSFADVDLSDVLDGATQVTVWQGDTGVRTEVTPSDARPAAPSNVEGYFLDDVMAWAHVKGSGVTAGATITIKDASGAVVASGTANGTTFDLPIDPAKVGSGTVALTVTQTVPGKGESAAAPVSLDYGQNTIAFTSPAEGGTIASEGQVFRGTGTSGGRVFLTGTNFSQDLSLGDVMVANDAWSITNSSIALPAGSYQLWASQFTKGGKRAVTAVNVNVTATAPAAPTNVEGYFPNDVMAWAHVKGSGVTAGATITIKDASGAVVASGTANGTTFDLPIDPAKVGSGTVALTVTQTVPGKGESAAAPVSLDYGQNTIAFTSPAEGGTIASEGQVFRGTGTSGGRVFLTGTNFSQDLALGDVMVANDAWSITNSSIALPAGSYQLWASQFTKGGKRAVTAVNVSVTATAPAEPTAVGHIDQQNAQRWAWVDGTAKSGAHVVVKDAQGATIAEGDAVNGKYSLEIDPTKVGWGTVALSVVQVVRGMESLPSAVTIDYGVQAAFAVTSPTDGGGLPGTGRVTFSGTASDATPVNLTGVSLVTNTAVAFGTPQPQGGSWSLTTDVDLPSGAYQVWASQFTPGGKKAWAAVNVTVTR